MKATTQNENYENTLEFKIGNRRLLLSYSINLKSFTCSFDTYEIEMNINNYGTYSMKEIDSLHFTLTISDGIYFDAPKDMASDFPRAGTIPSTLIYHFPVDYLREVEKCFETI